MRVVNCCPKMHWNCASPGNSSAGLSEEEEPCQILDLSARTKKLSCHTPVTPLSPIMLKKPGVFLVEKNNLFETNPDKKEFKMPCLTGKPVSDSLTTATGIGTQVDDHLLCLARDKRSRVPCHSAGESSSDRLSPVSSLSSLSGSEQLPSNLLHDHSDMSWQQFDRTTLMSVKKDARTLR